jgi:hypothetical protein
MNSPHFVWDDRPGRKTWNCRSCGCDVMFGPQCRALPPRGSVRAVAGCGEWQRARTPAGRLGAWQPAWSHHG